MSRVRRCSGEVYGRRSGAGPIKVLQVVGASQGGIGRHVLDILTTMDPQGFESHYAYSKSPRHRYFLDHAPILDAHGIGSLGLDARRLPHPSDLVNLYRVIRYIRRHGIEIVHGHGSKGGLYARLAGRYCRIFSLYTPHGGVVHDMFSGWQRRMYRAVERFLAPMTTVFVFESGYTRRAFFNLQGRSFPNSILNYSGIASVRNGGKSLLRSEGREDSDDVLRLGVFAIYRPLKGQHIAIAALPHLNRTLNRPVALHLFGEGVGKRDLRLLAEEQGVADQVLFRDHEDPITDRMAEMDIILIPSLFESFSYVALEAADLGLPVVASDEGGLKETVLPGNGVRFARGSARALADAVAYVVRHQDQFEQIELPQRFSSDRMVGNLERLYARLCDGINNASQVAEEFEDPMC